MNSSASTPSPAKRKKVLEIPSPLTTLGKNWATAALASHRANTQMPIAKERILSGKISASMSHTSGPSVPCMEKTNRTMKTRIA